MAEDEILSLIKRVRNSDEAASKSLVERMYPTIIRIVRNHLTGSEAEEDFCQEIFLKLFSKLHQFRADMPFEHWVSRIAVNTCIDHLRKQIFFSSRRRHTRLVSDWSSDVCSSD